MKGKKTELAPAQCAVARALDVVGDWWSLLIVREALFGRNRFSEFQKNIGLAKNILPVRLKKLVQYDVLVMEPDTEAATSHRYILTERGHRLALVIAALWQWGEENCFQSEGFDLGLADRETGELLAKLELKTLSGRSLDGGRLELAVRTRTDAEKLKVMALKDSAPA